MSVYHVEIRDFPRNVNRFNMSGQEVGGMLIAWAQERVFELADQKWNPQTAELTVIEGPEIPVSGLSMGRGWPTALREGLDVTERVVGEAREAIVDGSVARMAQEAGAQPQVAAAPAEPPVPAEAIGAPGEAQAAALDEGAGEAAIFAAEAPAADELALGVELAALLGSDAPRLLAAWREIASRASGLSPSETLALAERQLRDRDS